MQHVSVGAERMVSMNTSLREILDAKGRTVLTVSRDATVADAVHVMNRDRIGSVVVLDGGVVVGIFTERDVLARVVEPNLDPELTRVGAVMTPSPTCVPSSTQVCHAMEIMTTHRQRHLPVCDDRALVGLVSLGDLVYHLGRHLERHVFDLTRFVHGPYTEPPVSLLPGAPWEDDSGTGAGASA